MTTKTQYLVTHLSMREDKKIELNNINPTLTLTTVLTIKFKKKDERITSTQF